jgi:hypothetical protein
MNSDRVFEHLLETNLYKKLRAFFDDEQHATLALEVLTDRVAFPKRTIDWYITTFSRRTTVFVRLTNGTVIDLHSSYKAQLRSFSKKKFDIFKRNTEIPFELNGTIVMTTIGQLNFIRWFIVFNVHTHFKANKPEITRMARQPKASKTKTTTTKHSKTRSKNELNAGFSSVPSRVTFD